MATSTNAGRRFFVYNFTLSTSDTPIVINDESVNSFVIRCRTAVDLYLKSSAGATPYFTIPAGSALTLDVATNTLTPFSLQAASGTPVVEIVGTQE